MFDFCSYFEYKSNYFPMQELADYSQAVGEGGVLHGLGLFYIFKGLKTKQTNKTQNMCVVKTV